jgi:hypothetical protein
LFFGNVQFDRSQPKQKPQTFFSFVFLGEGSKSRGIKLVSRTSPSPVLLSCFVELTNFRVLVGVQRYATASILCSFKQSPLYFYFKYYQYDKPFLLITLSRFVFEKAKRLNVI